jgi:hypothetical protein
MQATEAMQAMAVPMPMSSATMKTSHWFYRRLGSLA